MQTIKTIVVVAVLLGIGYGVYVVLNPPPTKEPAELADADPDLWSKPPEVELGLPMPTGMGAPSASHDHAQGGHDSDHAATPSFPQPLSASATSGAAPASGTSDSTYGSSSPTPYGSSAPSAYGSGGASPAPASSDSLAGSGTGASVAPSAYAGAVETGGAPSAYARTDASDSSSNYLAGRSAVGGAGGVIPPIADGFDVAWRSAQQQLENNELGLALFTLSQLYGKPERTAEQNARLIPLLDQLAGTVIYSRDYPLEQHYHVLAGDTLEQIGQQYQVSPEFLARVNGIAAPYTLQPGETLKVVRGPFSAVIDTDGHEMTVFLGRYYAGRFPVSVGNEAAGQAGSFRVTEKAQQRTDYSTGQPIAPGQPGNPYGPYWIGLGGGLGLHGTPATATPGDTRGSLRLAPQDAADVFLILADGSEVTIR